MSLHQVTDFPVTPIPRELPYVHYRDAASLIEDHVAQFIQRVVLITPSKMVLEVSSQECVVLTVAELDALGYNSTVFPMGASHFIHVTL